MKSKLFQNKMYLTKNYSRITPTECAKGSWQACRHCISTDTMSILFIWFISYKIVNSKVFLLQIKIKSDMLIGFKAYKFIKDDKR